MVSYQGLMSMKVLHKKSPDINMSGLHNYKKTVRNKPLLI